MPRFDYFNPMFRIAIITVLIIAGCTEPVPRNVSSGIESVDFTFLQEQNKLYFSIELSDLQSNPDTVYVEWFGNDSSRSPDTLTLWDDGSHGDILINDGVWTLEISNTVSQELTYTVSSQTTGNVYCRAIVEFSGESSNLLGVFLLGNRIPEILAITAPDTVSLPDTSNVSTTFLVTCKVYDANGSDDIRRVSFLSYLSEKDSLMNGGNAIDLIDDGGIGSYSGDEAADDQIYSITVNLKKTATLGTYLWVFQAQDQSLAYSRKDSHYIVVEPYGQ